MPKPPKNAVTGKLPPSTLLKRYPNWMSAFELECADGCDESTIVPHKETKFIPDGVLYSVGTVTFADGRRFQALLMVEARSPDQIRIYDGKTERTISFFHRDRRWDTRLSDTSFRATRTKPGSVFPLVIEMTLPWEKAQPRSVYVIQRDGSTLQLQQSQYAPFIKVYAA
ncbi:MAG TPA: hypothetical protein VN673_05585 [Clostridia bacterium]|nr:hypothetical protein [Clostridia bacterium]